jgi:hypothetical protein
VIAVKNKQNFPAFALSIFIFIEITGTVCEIAPRHYWKNTI